MLTNQMQKYLKNNAGKHELYRHPIIKIYIILLNILIHEKKHS